MAAATLTQSFAIVTVVVLIFCACSSIVSSDPDTTFLFKSCNQVTYNSGEPYAQSVDYLLSDLVTITANHPGYSYYTQSPFPEAYAYGHGLCNLALTFNDCTTCIRYVKQQLVDDYCPNSIGAQVVLQDCQIRYEQYRFY